MSDAPEQAASRKFSNLTGRCGSLLDWYKANKPKQTYFSVTDEEYGLLRKYPAVASNHGFSTLDGHIYYRGFEVRPTSRASVNG